jgi:hypothetical protein
MRPLAGKLIILDMNRPQSLSKVLLVAEPRGTHRDTTEPLRRYRLARLRLDGRSTQPQARFDHLKRVFD